MSEPIKHVGVPYGTTGLGLETATSMQVSYLYHKVNELVDAINALNTKGKS